MGQWEKSDNDEGIIIVDNIGDKEARNGNRIKCYQEITNMLLKSKPWNINANEIRSFLVNNWQEIVDYFKDNEQAITVSRANIASYPGDGPDSQHETNLSCREWFTDFRKKLNLNCLEKEIRQTMSIPTNILPIINNMFYDIQAGMENKEKGGSQAQRLDGDKLLRRAEKVAEFEAGIDMLLETAEWPGMLPTLGQRSSNEDRFLIDDYINSWLAYNGKPADDERTANQLLEVLMDRSDPDQDGDLFLALATRINYAVKTRKIPPVGNPNGGFVAQEASLDSIFHLCWVLRGVKPADIDSVIGKLGVICSKVRGETKLAESMTTSASIIINMVINNVDDLGGGTQREHKWQHPLLVTLKRFVNGLTCIIPVPFPGQLINQISLDADGMAILALIYFVDKFTSNRAVERNSLWILHNKFKGRQNTFEYAGLIQGNVLAINLEPTGPVKFKAPRTTYQFIKSCSDIASITDQQIIKNLQRGNLTPNPIRIKIQAHKQHKQPKIQAGSAGKTLMILPGMPPNLQLELTPEENQTLANNILTMKNEKAAALAIEQEKVLKNKAILEAATENLTA